MEDASHDHDTSTKTEKMEEEAQLLLEVTLITRESKSSMDHNTDRAPFFPIKKQQRNRDLSDQLERSLKTIARLRRERR